MTRGRTTAVAAALLATLVLVSGCSGRPDTSTSETPGSGIGVIAPKDPVVLGDEVRVIVKVSDAKGPVVGERVTFDVVSGPGEYPDGFDQDTTDAAGVATSIGLHATSAGVVVVRIAAGGRSGQARITIK